MGKFTCYRCRQTFKNNQTEEEKLREYQANFGEYAGEDKGSLCDKCYEDFWKWAKVNLPELRRKV